MDDLFTLHPDEVFLRREALDRGYDDKDLRTGLREGLISRVRHGAYAPADLWSRSDDLDRHRMRAHAVLRSHDSNLALSHTSAAVEHGLRLYQPDLRRVHVTSLDGSIARSTPEIVYHTGSCGDDDLDEVNGQLVVEPVRAGIEAASLGGVDQGVVVLDSVIDLGKGTLDDIHRKFRELTGQPYCRKLQVVVRLVRTGSNSVAETLGRQLMWRQHVPEPVLQFEVYDEYGQLVGRCDYAWPEYGLLGEFDGVQKYGRLRREGETMEQAILREKTREDALREITGWLMIRIIWSELFTPAATAARLHRQLQRGARLMAA
jgi:hypothetical protein